MFELDQFGDCARFQPLEIFQPAGLAAVQDALDQRIRALSSQGLGECATQEFIGSETERGLPLQLLAKFAHHRMRLVGAHPAELGHGRAQALHFPRAEVPHDLGCLILAQAQQQHGGAIQPGEIASFTGHRTATPSPHAPHAAGPA
ncbi:hypothetical protein GALL_463450 [mine drainage metagenome]|uniref:Uncharacterized protein n=1 Tax=mine drainage metagenome TaxID=410659 RepID=A0A1J5PLJ5_9ZZZZ